jgi:perosamine synthetase
MLDPSDIIARLRLALGTPVGPVVLHEPTFAGKEWDYVKDCLDSTFVSSVGEYVNRFEAMLAEITGARHAVAVVNGTAALQVALQLAGVGRDDEVLMPALTFVATANAAAHLGAVPHFVDSAEKTLGLCPASLAAHLEATAEPVAGGWRNRHTGRRLAAIVPMHTFGHPVELEPVLDLAGRYGLPVVEDAAESLGSLYQGRHTGTFGQMGILSFNGNKIVTTGGGGAILTDDPELARHAKHLTTTAKLPHRWAFSHDEVAYNFRLPNLNAALGCAQLERLPALVESKRQLAQRYMETFSGMEGARVFHEPEGARSNYWLNVLLLGRNDSDLRDTILAATNDAGLMTRPAWTPLHRLPMYQGCPRADLPVAERLEQCLINLPSSAHCAARR